MEPDDLLCSRNARPQKALVGRAQWKINQAPSLRENGRSAQGVRPSLAPPFTLKFKGLLLQFSARQTV